MSAPSRRSVASMLGRPSFEPVEIDATREPVTPASAAARKGAPPPRDRDNGHGSSGAGGFLSRGHILDATAACFEARGYDGTTIRAIAGRLGCSVGAIYRYFADKDELLLTCAESVLDPVAEQLDGASVGWAESARRYAEAASARPQFYRLLFWVALRREQRRVPRIVERIIDHWSGQLASGASARQRWALLHGLLMLGESPDTAVAQAARLGSPNGAAEPARATADQPAVTEPTVEPATGGDDMTLL